MKTMTALCRTSLLLPLLLSAPACGGDDDGGSGGNPAEFDPDTQYAPDIDTAQLSAEVDNPLFPLPVGATWNYQAPGPDGLEEIAVSVEEATIEVWGAQVRVVRDTASIDGEMIEDTRDWYAQDQDGNVWYMGEDTAEYENGQVVTTEGSWTSGESGALPGVIMLGDPQVGLAYRQEYLAGEAEDYAEVVSLDETVEVGDQTYTGCLKTNDLSAVEDLNEFKYYCPHIGNVMTEEADTTESLISYDIP
jgi:hypothetical protein